MTEKPSGPAAPGTFVPPEGWTKSPNVCTSRFALSRETIYARIFYGSLITMMVAVFFWLARNVLPEALPFFVMAAAYGALLTRVLRASGRAFMAMYASFLLIYWSFVAVEDDLGVPAAAPWFMGFIIGAIAGGHTWSGERAGSQVSRKRERTVDGQGFTGGWQLALINAVSALLLLGLGAAHLIFQSPTAPVAAVLGIAVVGGWALFRFVTSVQIKYLSLFAIPVGLLVLGVVGGATDQLALPHVWAYGTLAGILIGGRYWSGPKFGEPRPPFAGQGGRRRRRNHRPRSKQKQPQKLRT